MREYLRLRKIIEEERRLKEEKRKQQQEEAAAQSTEEDVCPMPQPEIIIKDEKDIDALFDEGCEEAAVDLLNTPIPGPEARPEEVMLYFLKLYRFLESTGLFGPGAADDPKIQARRMKVAELLAQMPPTEHELSNKPIW